MGGIFLRGGEGEGGSSLKRREGKSSGGSSLEGGGRDLLKGRRGCLLQKGEGRDLLKGEGGLL